MDTRPPNGSAPPNTAKVLSEIRPYVVENQWLTDKLQQMTFADRDEILDSIQAHSERGLELGNLPTLVHNFTAGTQ